MPKTDPPKSVLSSEVLIENLIEAQEPNSISKKAFEEFKTKSNYIEVIEAYDKKNKLPGWFSETPYDELNYSNLPTEANTKTYSSNDFVFGDLNMDGLNDAVVTGVRSNGYNEIHFFYVFLNQGDSFKLVDVACESDLAGCEEQGWPNIFRNQKIENGLFTGRAVCHYNDAHCCPSITLKSYAKLIDQKLKFYKADFITDDDDFVKYRPTPALDSILTKPLKRH
ncbi:hypothetical protein JJL45_12875 [Tamlana sp. s12]|uniref:hypothetical protein n=1 Tax=Tamlana sp. s12 TaxID=1630406 RepID=UPI0007FE21C8|nr:hypothetical protein [Tamlana sp. s12]OBQ56560.1 hypothetical protein VQ01_04225 [Tamlana sp. s12]QQY81806.1 hypothetical protein JJL45_12875 [Tamlana sp. s12]